jgi:hypothetical protein
MAKPKKQRKRKAARPPSATHTLRGKSEITSDAAKQRQRYLDSLPRRQENYVTGLWTNARASRNFGDSRTDDSRVVEIAAFTRQLHDAVKSNDFSALESLLASQAMSLNMIFTTLVTWAAENIEDSVPLGDRLLRLAFKAQSQCRMTIESLAMMKNPTPAVFARQANIAHGPQQVNNAVRVVTDVSRAENENAQHELLEGTDGKRLDTATPLEAGQGDQAMAAMDTIDGPPHSAGQGDLVNQCVPRRRAAASTAIRKRTQRA